MFSIPVPHSGYVCLAGRPNSGKSTLLNRLVGQRISIVSPTPQTTRNRIFGILSEPRGQAVFLDTPGMHRPHYGMNRRMASLVTESLRHADLLVHVVDASIEHGAGERRAMNIVAEAGGRHVLVLNKIDLVNKHGLLPIIDQYRTQGKYDEFVPISALKGENIDALLDVIFSLLPEAPPIFPVEQVTDRPERFIVAEFIREQVCQRTRQEIPHAAAVLIDRFDESRRDQNMIHIAASIVVERQGHKKIIIGRGGEGIKAIGTSARIAIEQLLGCRVYLELFVKVVEGWRDKESFLDSLGIEG
jgi:GTP-binding protein Era